MSGLGIGERLIEAREQRGLSLEDAERDTRISRRYLQALEDERFDIIPAPVYARGFLRSYSQYLGVETAPLLARFPQDTPSPGSPSRPPSQEDRSGRGPSALFGSRVPEEPMIGVDIGVAIPTRRIGAGPTSFARTGVIAAVAIGVTALVVVLAIVIANVGGNGDESLTPAPTTSAATSEATTAAADSGLDVERGVVPDVIGQPEDIARRAVEEAGFVVTVVTDRNEQYPRGTVFEQAPTAGVEQEPGRGVFIAVSEGP
ncbi:MAG: helix-turn-helix domain-containing protein [Dehalococcoidia bacterium]|nr:helix-turn-helix domain-containing protein [Dehalococcoidia bacterium]